MKNKAPQWVFAALVGICKDFPFRVLGFDLRNQLYELLRLQTNFFSPCQKLISKTRHGAKVTKRYDTAGTPYQRVLADSRVTKKAKTTLTSHYRQPARTKRIRIGTTITLLSRRRPWVLARQCATLDRLSHGRMILGVGLGSPPEGDFGRFGEVTYARVRAEILDEALVVFDGLSALRL